MKFKLHAAVLLVSAAPAVCAGAHSPYAGRALSFADKQPSDDSIYDNVKRKLANDPDVKGGGLELDVKEGVVTLRGKVETDKQRQKAEKLAKKINGVKKVINEITLRK
ncbi:MAG TPA: BON domain-containing protein [Stellaceae bacterium]|nr:BON domain-containing protein [Stellaceae bacterium]